MKLMLRLKPIAAAAVAVCLVAAPAVHGTGPAVAQGAPQTLVGVDSVRSEPLSQTVPVIGRIVAMRDARVAAETAGAVESINVRVGDHVKSADVLAELNIDTKQSEVDVINARIGQAKADLEGARAQVTLAEQELKRQSDLKKSGAFARSKYETAEQELIRARARVSRVMALIMTNRYQRTITEMDIARGKVRAPFDGVVVERFTDSGSYLKVGDPVVRIISDTDLEIEADVPANRIAGLTPGLKIVSILEDGTKVPASVRSALPLENPMTRTRQVRFRADWPQGVSALADGQTITVHLPIGLRRQIVTVHKDAIVKQRGQDVVFVVDGGKAQPRTVKLGEQTGSRIEVVAGLKAGDVTVVRGNERLQPGTSVRVKKGSS